MTQAGDVDPVDPGDPVEPIDGGEVLGAEGAPLPLLAVRGVLGGVLMGLANLVPGISGGTMLLATGVYPGFVGGIAELSTLRFRPRSLVLLASIGGAAGLAILLLAGVLKALVVEQRWIMYSLFIGLTLGGVPLVWRLVGRFTPGVGVGAVAAFGFMVLMQAFRSAGASDGTSLLLLFTAGLAGASAMILPGVSGGYLLLLLGQYEPILDSIDELKAALLASGGPDVGAVLATLGVLVPVGLGVAAGVVGVSNLVRWLLERFEKPTLGVLLGLLLGAVVGLWPFQAGRPPEPGELVKGRVVTEANRDSFEPDDWPVERFRPTPGQAAASVALLLAGLGATLLIDRIGAGEGNGEHRPDRDGTPAPR